VGGVSFPTCPECGAELGPWEGIQCLSHEPSRARTIADQAVLVLEREAGPIYLHDIQRGIGREVGRRAYSQSVVALVGSDRRFCWSGKGLYALFRHGRIPGVRTLADVAAFILLAAGQPLATEELGFLMKWRGYRYQDTSLDGALSRERRFAFGWEAAGPRSPAGWKVKLKDRDAERARFDFLGQAIAQKVQAMLEAIPGGKITKALGFDPVALLGAAFDPDFEIPDPEVADARSATPADGEPWLEASLDDAQSSTAAHGESLLWPVDELLLRWGDTVQEGLEERASRLGNGGGNDTRSEVRDEP
jgi:hypothetical protein